MAIILREYWKREMLEKIHDPDFEFTTAVLPAVKWLILQLEHKKMAFRLLNFGAGVRKITRRTDVCPKCNGTGRI